MTDDLTARAMLLRNYLETHHGIGLDVVRDLLDLVSQQARQIAGLTAANRSFEEACRLPEAALLRPETIRRAAHGGDGGSVTIQEVFERYKHMDRLLGGELGHLFTEPETLPEQILRECWRAIKAAC